MKRILAFLLVISMSLFSIFADDELIQVVEGYDVNSDTITFTGNGRNETEAVLSALDGLEHLIVLEISNRCSELSKCVSRETIIDFIKFSAINVKPMSKNMIRYAYNNGKYKTDTGCAVVYCIKSDVFENMFEDYMKNSTKLTEQLEKKIPELVSVNRFLKKRYLDSIVKEIKAN